MSLERALRELSQGAAAVASGCKDLDKDYTRVRRRSKDLCEALAELHEEVTNAAEAASVFRALGGYKRNRRNSKDFNEDTLRASFAALDTDGSGSIDRKELRTAIVAENGSLKDEQIDALISFADADGNGEIDFDEYKNIMKYQSGVPTSAPAAAPPSGGVASVAQGGMA